MEIANIQPHCELRAGKFTDRRSAALLGASSRPHVGVAHQALKVVNRPLSFELLVSDHETDMPWDSTCGGLIYKPSRGFFGERRVGQR